MSTPMHYERSDPSEQEGKKTLHISKFEYLDEQVLLWMQ